LSHDRALPGAMFDAPASATATLLLSFSRSWGSVDVAPGVRPAVRRAQHQAAPHRRTPL